MKALELCFRSLAAGKDAAAVLSCRIPISKAMEFERHAVREHRENRREFPMHVCIRVPLNQLTRSSLIPVINSQLQKK